MLTIGITNWNELECTKECIKSLDKLAYPFKLFIWNNEVNETYVYKESDVYAHLISKLNLKNLLSYKIVNVNYNLGMTASWNWFLDEFQHDKDSKFCFVCNNDIRFTSTINNIIPFMENNEAMGLVCPAMLPKETNLEDLENIAYNYITDHPFNKNLIEMGGLAGPVMIIPKHVFEEVGYFDPQFRNSFNDMDYHLRVQKAGFATCVYHGSAVYHVGGVSTGKLGMTIENNPYYERFQRKHG